jgi:hypothetical protein
MNTFLKATLVGLYALALASLGWTLPLDAGLWLQRISLVLLGVHAIETVAMFSHVRKYVGPLAFSIALSLLFGLLHWLPLAKAGTPNGSR